MLVLSRKPRESIRIETGRETIVVHVNQIAGSRAVVGVEAPQHVRIVRSEIEDEEQGSPVG
jgi:carbon storage regulator CsrA